MRYFNMTCLILTLVLAGCSTLSNEERQKLFAGENDVFVGKTYDELVLGKGVPTGTATLSDGGKVVEYYNAQIEISGGETYYFPSTVFVQNTTGGGNWVFVEQMRSIPVRSWNKICKLDFVVSPKNVVASWKYEGRGCY